MITTLSKIWSSSAISNIITDQICSIRSSSYLQSTSRWCMLCTSQTYPYNGHCKIFHKRCHFVDREWLWKCTKGNKVCTVQRWTCSKYSGLSVIMEWGAYWELLEGHNRPGKTLPKVPYSRKLLRKNTFTMFAVLELPAKVFSTKCGCVRPTYDTFWHSASFLHEMATSYWSMKVVPMKITH